LFADSLAQLWDDFPAVAGEGLPGAPESRVELLKFGIEPTQLGITLFQALQFAPRFFAERDDLGQGQAVFALELVDQVQALFELLETRGVNVSLVGVVRKLRL
jgi:hypothetical protein